MVQLKTILVPIRWLWVFLLVSLLLGRPSSSKNDKAERWQLLFALTDLDNAYKSGKLTKAEYQQQRQEIKNHLRTIWEIESQLLCKNV